MPGLSFCLVLIQLMVGGDKPTNLLNVARLIREAARQGAQMIVLPVSDHVVWCLTGGLIVIYMYMYNSSTSSLLGVSMGNELPIM